MLRFDRYTQSSNALIGCKVLTYMLMLDTKGFHGVAYYSRPFGPVVSQTQRRKIRYPFLFAPHQRYNQRIKITDHDRQVPSIPGQQGTLWRNTVGRSRHPSSWFLGFPLYHPFLSHRQRLACKTFVRNGQVFSEDLRFRVRLWAIPGKRGWVSPLVYHLLAEGCDHRFWAFLLL